MSSSNTSIQSILLLSLSVIATVGIAYYWYSHHQLAATEFTSGDDGGKQSEGWNKSTSFTSRGVVSRGSTIPPPPGTPDNTSGASSSAEHDQTPKVTNTKSAEKDLHLRIEEFDKRGKVLFKEKQFLDAAQAFTEAIDLIESQGADVSSALVRQWVTLMNNRSAMYEKANLPELALEDCHLILEKDMEHSKARTRRLRLMELLERWNDALVEVCAIQLLFMKANRNNMRMGLPIPPPPIPQTRLEELLARILPGEVESYTKQMKQQKSRPLPCNYTILQLLRSYTGYNPWMGRAARDGSVDKISSELIPAERATDSESKAQRASVLLKRGRRYVYDKEFELASHDFEEALSLVEADEAAQDAMEGDSYARLLEWTGMVRHWHYNLDSALTCYQKCADLEPTNADVLVKQAGVQMDAGKHDEAMKLFDTALGIDPTTADALLHRSNLRMIQANTEDARKDLEECLKLRPNHVMARLRLASVLAAMNDASGAKRELDLAEQEDPTSSEVQSYRGELLFTQGQMEEAREQFEKAIQCDPSNPTPYVNAALVLLNTPTAPSQPPDTNAMVSYLEKAIEVDPQFTAAYLQLGQLTLGMATDLAAAREVITLYDRGLANCRTPEEVQELCSMRLLTVAQVEAATMLKMEVFSMQ